MVVILFRPLLVGTEMDPKNTKNNTEEGVDIEVSDDNMSVRSSVSGTLSSVRAGKRGRKSLASQGTASESSEFDEREPTFRKPLAAKRGKGRARTTVDYVGLTQEREAFLKNKNEEPLSEEEILKMAKSLEQTIGDNRSADQLAEHAQTGINLILSVAKKSGRLKGTMISSLKKATAAIQETVTALHSRTENEEVKLLRAANNRQENELTAIRAELAQIKADLDSRKCSGETISVENQQGIYEKLLRSITLEVGSIIDAKFAGIDDRLLPEKRLRPSLRGDSVATQQQEVEQITSGPTHQKAHQSKTNSKKTRPEKSGKLVTTSTRVQQAENLAATASDANAWQIVGKRGKAKPRVTQTNAQQQNAPNEKRKERNESTVSRVKKLRTPRSSAVAITLQPGALERGISYSSILRDAKAKLSMESLGISSVRVRTAATGARLLEIPGATSQEKADSLATELKKVLSDQDVKITRPTKCAELRISELDDSITSSEVATAVATAGGCQPQDVKTGDIKLGPFGNGSLWLRCPIEAAKKVAAGRLLVGWVSARVTLLDKRPTKCFRCLETGHVATSCQSMVDRSDMCYRCSKHGHQARACKETPNCALCVAKGHPAHHMIGSKACTESAPKSKQAKGRTTATAPITEPHKSSAEAMDIQQAALD